MLLTILYILNQINPLHLLLNFLTNGPQTRQYRSPSPHNLIQPNLFRINLIDFLLEISMDILQSLGFLDLLGYLIFDRFYCVY